MCASTAGLFLENFQKILLHDADLALAKSLFTHWLAGCTPIHVLELSLPFISGFNKCTLPRCNLYKRFPKIQAFLSVYLRMIMSHIFQAVSFTHKFKTMNDKTDRKSKSETYKYRRFCIFLLRRSTTVRFVRIYLKSQLYTIEDHFIQLVRSSKYWNLKTYCIDICPNCESYAFLNNHNRRS